MSDFATPAPTPPPNLESIISALLALDRPALQAWLSPLGRPTPDTARSIEQWLVPALERIGAGWESGEYALAQVYLCGRLCEALLDEWLPLPAASAVRPRLGLAVLEDYHLLGARLVYSALRAGGLPVQNYGRQTVETLVDHVQRDRVQVLLVSVLMLPSALRIRRLRTRLTQAGLKTKLLVGGAPFRFDSQLWQEVGADAMGRTAAEALSLAQRLLEATP